MTAPRTRMVTADHGSIALDSELAAAQLRSLIQREKASAATTPTAPAETSPFIAPPSSQSSPRREPIQRTPRAGGITTPSSVTKSGPVTNRPLKRPPGWLALSPREVQALDNLLGTPEVRRLLGEQK